VSIPRTRGDEPDRLNRSVTPHLYSPHPRG